MLVMLMMSLWLLLLSLQGMGGLLLAMADPPIGRTAENCMLASVVATAAETIERIVKLLYQHLQDVIQKVLIQPAVTVMSLCHGWVRTSWVNISANHAADIAYCFGLNLCWGRTNNYVETTTCISGYIIDCVIDVSSIALTLYSTSWTKLWQHPRLDCCPGRQTMVDGCCGEGNEFRVDFFNQWFIFHSRLSYAIEVCPVYKIHNFSSCKSKLALLNWSSRQRLNMKGTLNLPHECLWGM